jgi:predicted RNA-binding protein with PIN domain
VPLLDAAADTLRAIEPAALPLALQRLQGFDRRGLSAGPAQHQLRHALDADGAFREQVLERFLARPEVVAVLEQWHLADAVAVVEAADRRGDLPLLASVLWSARPEGHEFGLGLVAAAHEGRRREADARGTAEAEHRRREESDEARRRAEAARAAAEAEAAKVASQLRDVRAERRERDEKAAAATAAAVRRADALAAELAQARAAEESVRARESRAAQRAKELEAQVQRLKHALAEASDEGAEPGRPDPLDPNDARLLAQAAQTAHRLGATIDEVLARAAPSTPRGGPPKRARRAVATAPGTPNPARPLADRVAAPLPPGLVADSPMGVEAMLRAKGVVLVVDGYNVTQRAWAEAPLGDQRVRLAQALVALHARFGCESVAVFDGDGSTSIPTLQPRPGLRVEFSDAGEEADEVVVREARALPKRVPVVVASSDAWVREHAEAVGATVVSADALLAVLRG